jgi:hypothetical protein
VAREALENGKDVTIRLEADIKHKEGLKTGNVWGVLPGTTDENIIVMAHTMPLARRSRELCRARYIRGVRPANREI